jgi:DNA-binding protein Alba
VVFVLRLIWKRYKKASRINKAKKYVDESKENLSKQGFGEFVDTTPKVYVYEKDKQKISRFGVIYMCEDVNPDELQETIAYSYPIASTLKRERNLFPKTNWRPALFDYFSEIIAKPLNENLAAAIGEAALDSHREEYGLIKSLNNDNKLNTLVLPEARNRFLSSRGEISDSSQEEFIKLLKKWAKENFLVIRVGEKRHMIYVSTAEQWMQRYTKDIMFISRGKYIPKTVDVALIEARLSKRKIKDIDFDTWIFFEKVPTKEGISEKQRRVSVIRILLKR